MSIVSNFPVIFFRTPLGVFFVIFSSKTCDKISLVSAFYFREKRENGRFVVIVSFTSLSFVCVNLRDLRENMPFEHVKNGVMNRKQQNGRSRVSRGNKMQKQKKFRASEYRAKFT